MPTFQAAAGYPFAVNTQAEPWILEPAPMWLALLTDLQQGRAFVGHRRTFSCRSG